MVGYRIVTLFFNQYVFKLFLEAQILERVWTIIPAFILTQIAWPSLILLYNIDDISRRIVSLKVRGHQWYWSYEYRDFWPEDFWSSMEFDTYIACKDEDKRELGIYRLLDRNYRPVLPRNTQVQILITRADVLHAWTIPRLGIKADANPGRLNQVKLFRQRPGVFYGQCSEICGANHRFMPIVIELFPVKEFLSWVVLTRVPD